MIKVTNRGAKKRLSGVAVACATLVSATIITAGCHRNNGTDTGTGSGTYEEKASALTIGTIALESRDDKHDRPYLTKLTQLAPEEPAGWANLGLKELRSNNLKAAADNFEKARKLAPDNADIEKLLAVLADHQNDQVGAVKHGLRAVQLAPNDLRARYALAQVYSRQGTPEADAGYQEQLTAILEREPTNMLAQLELAVAGARRGDKAALQKATDLLAQHAPAFDTHQATYFQQLKAAVAGPDPKKAMLPARFLQNTLVKDLARADAFNTLTRPEKEGVGDPLRQFVKLPPISGNPAEPDAATTFTPQPEGTGPAALWSGSVWIDGDGNQANITLDAAGAHVAGKTASLLKFNPGADPYPGAVLAMDVNYDLRTDIALAGPAGFKLFTQNKDGSFADATTAMKLPAAVTSAPATGAWGFDIEADGDLDIILGAAKGAPQVLRNNGDGTWMVTHPFSGIDGTLGVATADLDGDGSPDLLMIDGKGTLHLFANDRGGTFHQRTLPALPAPAAAVASGDITRRGTVDFLVLLNDGSIKRISDHGYGTALDVTDTAKWSTPPAGMKPGHGALLVADLDNNGALDIVASEPGATAVFMGDAHTGFVPLPTPIGGQILTLAAPKLGGRYDLAGLSATRTSTRFVNSGKTAYHWQDLRPHADPSEFDKVKYGDRRINAFGFGGEVEARAGLLYNKLQIDGAVIHFGLGDKKSLDAVRILWPNGDVRGEFADELKPDQSLELPHRLHASCPFLFTWNGSKMAFVTDCIWRSALGLKINAQDTAGIAQTEDWVKVRGDQLTADANGEYDMRVTAELWETHFFDHLSLISVDHPANTEVYVDERFAIPPPPHRVYVTTPAQPVKKAVDDRGTDVTELVRARDLKHVDTFGRGNYQGVTRDHYIEVELPEAAPNGPLFLICSGWIHPTSSSINVALGQSHEAPPSGLQLETPDAAGKWSVAKPGLGFPEGKVKTILIDLNGAFKPNAPRKLRLRTNLEIYWDCIQWAAPTPTAVTKQQHIAASSAELQYRGFSDIKAADNSSPELPASYDGLISEGRIWRDLEGYYTRYGDIKELLEKVDDRYVIMNAGDEIRMKFKAPQVAPGMVRDFVLVGDGWVKDGDLNTTFSKTVMPLPAHDISDYSHIAARLEDDPAYKKHPTDWQKYHTRYVQPVEFGHALHP